MKANLILLCLAALCPAASCQVLEKPTEEGRRVEVSQPRQSPELTEIESLLAEAGRSSQAETKPSAVSRLSNVVLNTPGTSRDFVTAIDLVAKYRVTETIPILIEQIDRRVEYFSIKPWSNEYPCTRGLVQLGDVAGGPLLSAALVEKEKHRQDLLIYTLLGIYGPMETKERLEQALKGPGDESVKERIVRLLERAEALRTRAPTHLAPKHASGM